MSSNPRTFDVGTFNLRTFNLRTFNLLIKRISPTLMRITQKLNGRFSFMDHDDLYQEAVLQLWIDFQSGRLEAKTDSYILQGCYFHLKNYIRKTQDSAKLVSLNTMIDEESVRLEELIEADEWPLSTTWMEDAGESLLAEGMNDRESACLRSHGRDDDQRSGEARRLPCGRGKGANKIRKSTNGFGVLILERLQTDETCTCNVVVQDTTMYLNDGVLSKSAIVCFRLKTEASSIHRGNT
jgi:DNA-directed RNA polymerase specialized sigma24 family protein